MKTIRTFSNLSEAGFASSLLEAAGIKALLADEQSFTIGYNLAAMGLRLQVDDADVERAEQVLDQGPDAAGVRPSEAEAPDDGKSPVPAGVFIAGAVVLGVLAFAIYQIAERRGTSGMFLRVQTYELDSNGDGKPDRFGTYRGEKNIAANGDNNFDGKPDVWEFFDDRGTMERAEQDQNFDGKVDAWFTYEHGIIKTCKTDADFDGRPDWISTYEHGIIARSETIPNEPGRASRIFIYKSGVLTEETVDENRDGIFDYKIQHDPFGGMSERIPMERAK